MKSATCDSAMKLGKKKYNAAIGKTGKNSTNQIFLEVKK